MPNPAPALLYDRPPGLSPSFNLCPGPSICRKVTHALAAISGCWCRCRREANHTGNKPRHLSRCPPCRPRPREPRISPHRDPSEPPAIRGRSDPPASSHRSRPAPPRSPTPVPRRGRAGSASPVVPPWAWGRPMRSATRTGPVRAFSRPRRPAPVSHFSGTILLEAWAWKFGRSSRPISRTGCK